MRKLHYLIAASVLTIYSSAGTAGSPSPDAAAYLQAFNETCRRGFPDFDVIAENARSHGWQESSLRRVDGGADILSPALPRAFHKDGLMLFLTHAQGGGFKTICQVTGSSETKLTGADVTALVSPSLNAGTPTLQQDAENDKAIWSVAPGMSVEAGISIHRRKARSISIAVRQAR